MIQRSRARDAQKRLVARARSEGFPDTLPELLMVPPADALVALAKRARLQLRRERTWRHDTLAVREVEDTTRQHLNLALSVTRLRVLVRPALRMVRVRRAAQG